MMCRKVIFFALFTFFLAGIASAADPNLVGWYKFNETSGTVAADSSGYGNNATVNASSGWDTGGKMAGCLNFTGTLQVSIPAAVFTDVKEQVTISVWVNGNTLYPTTGQVPFHGAGPLRGRALQCEMPGGASSIWFAAGDTTSDINGGYDQNAWYSPPLSAYQGQWNNFTFVKNNIADVNEPTWIIYWNGLMKATDTTFTASMSGIDTFVIGSRIGGSIPYYGKLDEFKIFDRALSRQEIADMLGVDLSGATNPRPLDGQVQVAGDATLVWDAGLQAASHDVYLGTNQTAVANATTASIEYMGNFPDAEYTPPSGLVLGTLYYWRVDEINDIDIWPGDVWSFTVIPPIPPMPEPLLWLKMDGVDPDNARLVKDYSATGMNGTMGSSDQWIDIPGIGGGIDFDGGYYGACGITFEPNDTENLFSANFDKTVTVSYWMTYFGMTNFEGRFDPGKGAQYPYDGRTSVADGEVRLLSSECPTGPWLLNHCGTKASWNWGAFNPSNPSIFRGDSTWGDYQRWTFTADLTTGILKTYIDNEQYMSETFPLVGIRSMADIRQFWVGRNNNSYACFEGNMSDFRLYNEVLRPEHIEELVGDYPYLAKVVYPAHQSVNIPLNTDLVWRPGKDAVAHDIYFSKNLGMVANADISSSCYMGQQTATTYPMDDIEMMKTYYWRIDEVNSLGDVLPGPVWQFNTIDSIVVEDFESYDAEGNSIGAVWTDKYGYLEMDISLNNPIEGGPVLSPINSMKLLYHLPYDPYYSVAACTFSSAQDWTVNGVKMLTIHYYGDATNMELPAFVTIGDGTNDASVFVNVNTLAESWGEINVSLPAIELLGVDLSNVTYMEIGFGDGTDQGMSFNQKNTIYVDDIVLYPPKCVLSESSLQADITGDCVVNYNDLAFITEGWLREASSAETIAAAGPVGLWLFDDNTNLTKATVGNNLTTGIYGGTGGALAAVPGIAAGDGAVMVPLNTYLIVDPTIVPAPYETRVNEYTMVWDVSIPEASAYAPLRWAALCEFDIVDLTSDADIFVHYWTGSRIDGVFGTHQGASAELVKPDTWYQLAVSVKNGQFFNCYVNGELAVSLPAEAIDGRYSIADKFHIFKDNDSEDPDINCSTFALFDRALTAAEIKSLVPAQLLKGDLNDDTAIDFVDYSILANEWLVEDFWP